MKRAHRFNSTVATSMVAVLVACAPIATVATIMAATLSACTPPGRTGPGEVIDDSLITTKVKAALAEDPAVKATEVQVETYKGTVQLSGFVSSPEAVQKAAELARKVEGVKTVKNDILVRK